MSFVPLPLGQRIPASLHGVSCSLPTMRDVIGYEEKDPAVVRHLTSGYPRFVQHPLLKQAAAYILRQERLTSHHLWLTSSARAAHALDAWLDTKTTTVIANDELHGVAFPEHSETFSRAKTWLQHTGALASSRAAEDFLVRAGQLRAPEPETLLLGDADGSVRAYLSSVYHPASEADIFLANSGMNAIWGAFRAVSALQAPRGRRVWVQLGWLYLDTIAILQKFTGGPENYLLHSDVFDFEGFKALLANRGHEIAGVITEIPTNPLIQTPDLAAVHRACRDAGVLLVVDPTVVSPVNIDVLPFADVVVNSLTKYTASEGDVIFGATIVNPASADRVYLRSQLASELEPVYSRDLSRLAAQITNTEEVVKRTNENAAQVVAFLKDHPRITSLFWSLKPESEANYLKLARSPDCIGSMISFTVKGDLAAFYDRVALPKGPSFGMKTTLICPFIYLAHFDLINSAAGRALLAANQLSPELLRLSVGCESSKDIIAALEEALA